MGSDEVANGTVQLRDLAAGSQAELPRAEVAAALLDRLQQGTGS